MAATPEQVAHYQRMAAEAQALMAEPPEHCPLCSHFSDAHGVEGCRATIHVYIESFSDGPAYSYPCPCYLHLGE